MIGFPRDISPELNILTSKENAAPAGDSPKQVERFYEEWGYAERAWYVEGQQGISGMVRALFWPTPGTVEVAGYDRLWASRTPQPPADLFVFTLSGEGLVALRRHLLSTLEHTNPIASIGRSDFYPSRRAYHLFHHCHHYVARALREAGLPVSPFWAITRSTLAMQLRRAQRVAEESRQSRVEMNNVSYSSLNGILILETE